MPAISEVKHGFFWAIGLMLAFFVVSRLLTLVGLKQDIHLDADTALGG